VARRGDDDPDALDRLRAVAAGVFIALSALVVLAITVGRAVPEVIVTLVFGTLLALLGLEATIRAVRGNGDSDE